MSGRDGPPADGPDRDGRRDEDATGTETAVVLAAGEGSRLAPFTEVRPKPMLPIANRPLLEYVIEAVAAAGIEEVVLVVGYKRERIQNYFEDGADWGVHIEYAVQESQLGTGHAVLQAESAVDGPFVVLNGDRIVEPEVVTRLREAGADPEDGNGNGDGDGDPDAGAGADQVVMAVTRSERPSQYGVVSLDGRRVTGITEKPAGYEGAATINAGAYRFPPDVFEAIRATERTPEGELAVTTTIERYVERGGVLAVRYPGLRLDVTQLWDIPPVNEGVLDRRGGGRAASARVHPDASVAEAVQLGSDARVQPGAAVLSGTSLGDNVTVGPNAVVENAVVMADATVDAGAVVRDCVIGENATVGPNVTIEGGRADLVVEGTVHEGVSFGGAVGDNAHVGGTASLRPGRTVGTDAVVESGVTVGADVPSGAEVRR
jgi:glucose-1-phosphate thymidylyltransferase